MTQVKGSETLQNYLQESEKFEEQSIELILESIERFKQEAFEDKELVQFFKGECEYYQGKYDQALQYYLLARSVPQFQFFCNRASAHIAFNKGQTEKAMRFIEKALSSSPSDRELLALKQKIQEPNDTFSFETNFQESSPLKEEDEEPSFDLSQINFKEEEQNQYIAEKLGSDLTLEHAIEARTKAFDQLRSELISEYLNQSEKRQDQVEKGVYILNGTCSASKEMSPAARFLYGKRQTPLSCSGFYIRWEGKGIVVNPGESFLENFHEQDLFVKDIDYVIITRDNPRAYADIKRIYNLNYQLNQVSPELHVINYYLNQKAYEELGHTLKPHFKQERDTVHCLELFLDSPDVENIQLDNGILLHYFSTTPRDSFFPSSDKSQLGSQTPYSLGIRFELTTIEENEKVTLGYVTGTSWSPLIAHNLGKCDLLITGFGTTNLNDYSKLNYTEGNLGYYGTFSLTEATAPKLVVCTEFSGREGDVRLEIAKKLRSELNIDKEAPSKTQVLPGDPGLMVDLKTFTIKCSVTRKSLDPANVRVVKTHETFGHLQYLAPDCIL
ncbi:MAG: tetratricopeptide repeat protein [Waddliaceae bacterium]